MQIEIRALTFGGFYGGCWDQGENEYRDAQWEEALEVCQLKDDWGYGPDYRDEVAKIYAEYYIDMVNEILDVDFKIISQEIDSPREYNFTNDKIFIQVEVGDYEALVEKLIQLASKPEYRTELAKIIHDQHTSCSGFWSWMSNDIEEWFGLMYNPNHADYTSYFIAYLMSLINPEMYDNLDDRVYCYIYESTGILLVRPETDKAQEEYEMYLQYPEAYAAFVEHNCLSSLYPDDEDWSEKDFPIVIASFKYSDEQADYNVSRVTVNENGCLTVFGFRKDYGGPEDENELYYIEFGHIGNITDFIPETEEVDNVTINNPAPILILSPEDVENVGYSSEMTVSQFSQITRLMEKSFEWNMEVYWDALKQACENAGIQKLKNR